MFAPEGSFLGGAVVIGDCQNLLIDADDTLWENNIYFERVIHQTIRLLEQAGADSIRFREVLDQTERNRIPLNGYGTVNFTHSLMETFRKFLPPGSEPSLPAQVEQLSLAILDRPLELMEGVPETLAYLSGRHSLFLVTKGDPAEQSRKIRTSNLGNYFKAAEILAEKNAQAYARLMTRHNWDPSRTWMIGNSPRSDINPALAAGLSAVYIPHLHTWTLEHEDPADHPNLVKLEKFSDLRHYF